MKTVKESFGFIGCSSEPKYQDVFFHLEDVEGREPVSIGTRVVRMFPRPLPPSRFALKQAHLALLDAPQLALFQPVSRIFPVTFRYLSALFGSPAPPQAFAVILNWKTGEYRATKVKVIRAGAKDSAATVQPLGVPPRLLSPRPALRHVLNPEHEKTEQRGSEQLRSVSCSRERCA